MDMARSEQAMQSVYYIFVHKYKNTRTVQRNSRKHMKMHAFLW